MTRHKTPCFSSTGANEHHDLERDLSASLLAKQVPEMFLRIDDVTAITGLSTSTIYRLMGSGAFPMPFRLTPSGNRATAWRLTEVMGWIDGRERVSGPTTSAQSVDQ